jgi:hypothetical protein
MALTRLSGYKNVVHSSYYVISGVLKSEILLIPNLCQIYPKKLILMRFYAHSK